MAQTATAIGSGIKQPYHVPDPSPWPIVGAIAALVAAFGLISYMHPDVFGSGLQPTIAGLGRWVLLPGVVLILFTMAMWWSDVVTE